MRAAGKALHLAARLPVADFLQVADGRTSEGQGVLIIRRAELRSERGNPEATVCLCRPDQAPPGLVRFQMPLIFGGTWIRHLGPLFVAYAGVNVQTVIGALTDDADLVFDQSFANADPVAEIAAQFQVRKARQQTTGDPGIKKNPAPVRFVRDGDPALGFELKRALEKASALILREGVLSTVGVDKASAEGLGGDDLFAERVKVVCDALALREDLRDELQTVFLEQSAEPLPVFRRRHGPFDSPVTGLLELREDVFPLACRAPKVAEKNEVHVTLYFAHYSPNASGRAGAPVSKPAYGGRARPPSLLDAS